MNQLMPESFRWQFFLGNIDRGRPVGGLDHIGLMVRQAQAGISEQAAILVVLLNIFFSSGTVRKKRQAFEGHIRMICDLKNG